MFVLLFLLSIKITFQIKIQLYSSNTIPNLTSTIKQSKILQEFNVTLPLLTTCFGTPEDCFNMTLETNYFNTFLDGTGDFFQKYFNKTKSSSFISTNQTLFFNYQNKELKGNYVIDKMIYKTKDTYTPNKNFAFILLEEKNKLINKILIDGIIGLKKNNSQTNNCSVSFLNFSNIESDFSFQLSKNKDNFIEGYFLLDENKDKNIPYSICKNENNINKINNDSFEWKCNITNISIGISSNTPILFNEFAYFSVSNPLIELPYELGYYILNRLYEQSESECEIIKEENISIFVCNASETDITKFDKIHLYYNKNKTNSILLNPKNYFEKVKDKYICKIVQNKNIKNIILGLPAFLDNTFIFDLKNNAIKIKENKENYLAYILIIGIIGLILIVIPVIIFIYEYNKNEKNFRKLDINNTNNLIEKN